jgi:acetylornithine deacetylase
VLGIEIGTQPGETITDRVAEIEEIFREVKKFHPEFQGEVRVQLARDPFEASGHEDLWNVVSSEIEKSIGKPVESAGANAWGDAALFQAAGIPTIMFGAQGDHFHAPEEWVSLSDLVKLGEILTSSIKRFCALPQLPV